MARLRTVDWVQLDGTSATYCRDSDDAGRPHADAAPSTRGQQTEDRRHSDTLAPTFDRAAAGADASPMHTTIVRTRVLTIAAIAAIAVGACGAPATPDLTSPTEIVLATLATTETAKSVHLEATVSGEVKMSVLPGAPATPIDLTGTTVSGDVALDAGAVHATFKVPNLFDLAGELIVVDGKGYFKTTVTGAQYQVTSLGEAIPKTGKGLADTLGDLLMSEDITLTKGGDVGCGGKQCYTVTTQLTAEDLGGVQDDRSADRHRGRVRRYRDPGREGAPQPPWRPDRHADPARRRPRRRRRRVLQVGRGGHRDRAPGRPGRGRVSPPTYNGRVSPTRRRRTGDPTLDDAAEAAAEAAGTAFADLDEAPRSRPRSPPGCATRRSRDRGPGHARAPAGSRGRRSAAASSAPPRSSGPSTPSRHAPSRRPTARC